MYQHFLFKPQIDGKSNAKNSISIRFKIITNVEKKLEIGPIKENSHYSKCRPRKQEFQGGKQSGPILSISIFGRYAAAESASPGIPEMASSRLP